MLLEQTCKVSGGFVYYLASQPQFSLFVKGNSRLKRHLKHYHSVEEEARRASFKFECPECHKKIRTKNLLDCHLKVCVSMSVNICLSGSYPYIV